MFCNDCASIQPSIADEEVVQFDLVQAGTIQAILQAIAEIPGVQDRVDAYLLGFGFDDPDGDIAELWDVLDE